MENIPSDLSGALMSVTPIVVKVLDKHFIKKGVAITAKYPDGKIRTIDYVYDSVYDRIKAQILVLAFIAWRNFKTVEY